MALLFSSTLADLLAITAGLFGLLYWYFVRNFDFWKKRGIPFLKPLPLFGNIKDMVLARTNQNLVFQDLYNQLEGHKYGGIFQMMDPTLLLRDPDIIKTILVKDFNHFQDRGFNIDTKVDPLMDNLFALGGWRWRALRIKLSPTFTSGKMKMMFHVMEECAKNLQQYIAKSAALGEILELKEVLAKFTTDVIGTAAFGLQMNALDDPDSEFRKMGRKAVEPGFSNTVRAMIVFFLPRLSNFFAISFFPSDVNEFFLKVVKETVEYREKNNITRNDFLQLLIALKKKGEINDERDSEENVNQLKKDVTNPKEREIEMDDALLAAQVTVFFVAGFETSSTTMSFALHELAVNPDIQAKLREEIDTTLEATEGKFTYDALMSMKYMDKVVSETLRKYPPVGTLDREVTIPYILPDVKVKLEVGTRISIPVYALQNDPKYFPDPDRFDPERFNEEEKAKRPHYVYMPFGEGPRNCIGMRFGLLQTKMGLAALLSKYEFHVCERTEIPIRFDPTVPVTASTTGIILKVMNRRDREE